MHFNGDLMGWHYVCEFDILSQVDSGRIGFVIAVRSRRCVIRGHSKFTDEVNDAYFLLLSFVCGFINVFLVAHEYLLQLLLLLKLVR